MGASIIKFIFLCIALSLPYSAFATNTIAAKWHEEKPVVYLFSHGLGGSYQSALFYKKQLKLNRPIFSFPYQDAIRKRIDFSCANLGQDHDIKTLVHAYRQLTKKTYPHKIVVIGESRGASTALILSTLSNLKKNLAAIIAESPYDAIESILNHIANHAFIGVIPGISSLLNHCASMVFSQYKKNGQTPLEYIHKNENRPLQVPILIVCSSQDILTPWRSSVRLYRTLKNKGHTAVHLLILAHGHHAQLLEGKSGHHYQKTLHAFFKHYQLPHNKKLACAGKELFLSTQPNEFFTNQLLTTHSLHRKKMLLKKLHQIT